MVPSHAEAFIKAMKFFPHWPFERPSCLISDVELLPNPEPPFADPRSIRLR